MGSTLMVTVSAPVDGDDTPAATRDAPVMREWISPWLEGFDTAAEVTDYSARR